MHKNGQQHEWFKLRVGRRKLDPLISVDFHGKRMCIEHNTGWVVGVYLEQMDPGKNNTYPGMILMKAGWEKQYFLQKRKTWSEDDYFKLAERLMWEKGIRNP